MMKRSLLILLLIVPIQLLADEIKIASWNIAWLSNHENNMRTEADYSDLRRYADKLNADIIALQEVETAAMTGKALGDGYDYYISTNDWFQRVGIAIRKNSGYTVNAVEYKALNVDKVRFGMDVALTKGNKKLRVLGVHLKSGCFDNPLDQQSIEAMPNQEEGEQYRKLACSILAKQIEPLEAWIDERAKEGVPFVILGDFNRRFVQDIAKKHTDDTGLWQAIDDDKTENLWTPTLEEDSKCWGGYYKDYIDHIVLDPKARAQYVDDSFEQIVFKGSYKEDANRLSDHCPIALTLNL